MSNKLLKNDPLNIDYESSYVNRGDMPSIALDGNPAWRYDSSVIKSFKCSDTEDLFNRKRVARFVHIETVARRKLEQLNQAGELGDLRIPPGNRLESLKGARAGQYSIRVNNQYRVCFRWEGRDVEDVEIVDYH